jgi:hypothetical protein
VIKLGKKLKLMTLRLPIKTSDIFERMDWLIDGVVKAAPAGTIGYIMSPRDLSDVNKAFYSKIRFASAEQAAKYMDMFKQAGMLNLYCSPAVALGCIIYLVED